MIIFDCEIARAIPINGEKNRKGIKYCKGWDDFKGMGISVISVYDYSTGFLNTFTAKDFEAFQELVDDTDLVIGFNCRVFDDNLCRAHDINIPLSKTWDLQVEIWKAAGLSETFSRPSHSGLGLYNCTYANFGEVEYVESKLIPILWQEGKVGTVISHCRNDVKMIRLLLDKIEKEGHIIDPRKMDEKLYIKYPDPSDDLYETVLDCVGVRE